MRKKEPESRGIPPINDVVMLRLLALPIARSHPPLHWGYVVMARNHSEHATTLDELLSPEECQKGARPRMRKLLG